MTGDFPAQRANNAENVSIWWRHHVLLASQIWWHIQLVAIRIMVMKYLQISAHAMIRESVCHMQPLAATTGLKLGWDPKTFPFILWCDIKRVSEIGPDTHWLFADIDPEFDV